MNETVGEEKLNSPLYEGPSEPSVRNSKTGGNEFTINNYPGSLTKYHFRFQKADASFVTGMTFMDWKVDFFHYDTNNIIRLAGTILKPWTKFFVCLQRKITASGNTHIYRCEDTIGKPVQWYTYN